MAKWKVTPGTEGNTMSGTHEYDEDGTYRTEIQQDISGILEKAKNDRDNENRKSHYAHFCTIPHVVAIEIKEKHGIDVFDPLFMQDSDKKMKVFLIIQQEYPKLKNTNLNVYKK